MITDYWITKAKEIISLRTKKIIKVLHQRSQKIAVPLRTDKTAD